MFQPFFAWWNAPYQDGMSVPRWFLFIGLLLVIGVVWRIVIRQFAD